MEQLDLPHREGDPDRLLVSQESAQRQRLLSAVHQRRVQDEVGEGSLQLVGKPELRDGLGVVASHPLHRAKARPEMKPQPASPFVALDRVDPPRAAALDGLEVDDLLHRLTARSCLERELPLRVEEDAVRPRLCAEDLEAQGGAVGLERHVDVLLLVDLDGAPKDDIGQPFDPRPVGELSRGAGHLHDRHAG